MILLGLSYKLGNCSGEYTRALTVCTKKFADQPSIGFEDILSSNSRHKTHEGAKKKNDENERTHTDIQYISHEKSRSMSEKSEKSEHFKDTSVTCFDML